MAFFLQQRQTAIDFFLIFIFGFNFFFLLFDIEKKSKKVYLFQYLVI